MENGKVINLPKVTQIASGRESFKPSLTLKLRILTLLLCDKWASWSSSRPNLSVLHLWNLSWLFWAREPFCPLDLFIWISVGHISYLLYMNSCTHYLLRSLSLLEITDLDVYIPTVCEFSTVYGQYWVLNKWMKSEWSAEAVLPVGSGESIVENKRRSGWGSDYRSPCIQLDLIWENCSVKKIAWSSGDKT